MNPYFSMAANTMNPYFMMASAAMMNATTYFNATAQDFWMNQWPMMASRMDILWNRFQSDPSRWVALYPISLFLLAFVIWTSAPTPTGGKYIDPDDILRGNTMSRRRNRLPVLVVTPFKSPTDHPMIRRSQATRYYMYDNDE